MAKSKLKVVQVLPALDGGGVERGTLEVAEALVHVGHESVVISAGGRMVPELESAGSRHVTWNLGKKSPFTLLQVPLVRRWLLQEQPDILHLRSRMPAWILWLAWRSLPVEKRPRLVTTVHGLYSVSGYSRIMCRGERVIAVSKTIEDYIFKHYPQTEKECVRLIYRGVDPADFPRGYEPARSWLSAWYKTYPQLQGKVVLTLPGRLTRLKGHHDFILLMDRLIQSGMDVYGLIVGGEDPKRQSYARELYVEVERLGMSQRIIFTGHRGDVRDIYAVSDVVLSLSTKQESFGRTVLEALSLGRPVVGYDHGGVGEILGELFPQGRVSIRDQAQLIEKVILVLGGDLKPKESHRFIKQSMLEQTLSLYAELGAEH
ncbi:MAG: glycosyltransferase family 4 protein [Chromatiales bacterium]|nr:glycosyltransferase family 4 protein [Chromatiales bacterium]